MWPFSICKIFHLLAINVRMPPLLMIPMVTAPRRSRITASTCGCANATRAIERVQSEVYKKTSYDVSDSRSEGQEFALFHGTVSFLSAQ